MRRLLLAALIALGMSCPSLAQETPATDGLSTRQTKLAQVLLTDLATAHPGANVTVSPASLAAMLSAAALGADDATRADIARVLQLPPGTEATRLGALRSAIVHRSEGELTSASRIVIDRSAKPSAGGLQRLVAAGIEGDATDLHRPQAVVDLNAWVARATHGMISRIVDTIDPAVLMVAVNALYFDARWQQPFDAKRTRPGDFHPVRGRPVRVPMMHTESHDFAYRQDEGFVAVALPFEAGHFSLVLVTTKAAPAAFPDFESHLDWLGGDGFSEDRRVVLALPRFKLHNELDLTSTLKRIGYKDGDAFPAFAETPLRLAAVIQTVAGVFDERGARVAAVTGGVAVAASAEVIQDIEVTIDKPFVFALKENKTGLVIAAGYVAAP